jgi:hypothetical protein
MIHRLLHKNVVNMPDIKRKSDEGVKGQDEMVVPSDKPVPQDRK